ncbi:MAG TPA: MazG nucleotide pyrophosphohydrolase domain-containing protein, partial [Actinomycetota bacterium]|nr:MazG nucleotide pyrophosphohydrolase domain-containing protein [Actinomycetota bacterium]
MPVLVVPVAGEDASSITLAEWDELAARSVVYFEEASHPLADRLRNAGVEVAALEAGVDLLDGADAVVVDPRSPRILDLARGGAHISTGVSSTPDGLSAAHGAYVVRRAAESLGTLAIVMARLRSADGCPWDREQTHASLQVHLVEETYEVIDAIERDSVGDELAEELGDVLLQVAFHSQLAAEDGRFDLVDVADHIVAKLLRRHPHVFGETVVADADEVVRNWEA